MKAQLISIATTALIALSPVLLALTALCAQKLHNLIAAKVHSERVAGILFRLEDASRIAVSSVEQSIISKLDPSKSLGENAQAAKIAALNEMKSHLGPKGIDEIKTVLGIGQLDLDQVLSSHIEAKVGSATLHNHVQTYTQGGAA